jgi:hypothetical protein
MTIQPANNTVRPRTFVEPQAASTTSPRTSLTPSPVRDDLVTGNTQRRPSNSKDPAMPGGDASLDRMAESNAALYREDDPVPAVTREQFLQQNGDRTVPTEALRKLGFDARTADADGDGAISGREWEGVWRAIDAADRDGNGQTVDANNEQTFPAVKQRLDAVAQAADGKAPYDKDSREQVNMLLELYPDNQGKVERLDDKLADAKGLPRGTAKIEMRDGGNRNVASVAVYLTPDGKWFKELKDPTDKKDTPVVPLTPAEKAKLDENPFLSDAIHTDAADSRDARYQLAREFGGAGH